MYKPLGNYVLVKPLKEKSSKIHIPEMSKKQKEEGEVLAVGGEVTKDVKKGDKVVFRKYSPEEFKVDGEVVFLIEDVDLMAVCLK